MQHAAALIYYLYHHKIVVWCLYQPSVANAKDTAFLCHPFTHRFTCTFVDLHSNFFVVSGFWNNNDTIRLPLGSEGQKSVSSSWRRHTQVDVVHWGLMVSLLMTWYFSRSGNICANRLSPQGNHSTIRIGITTICNAIPNECSNTNSLFSTIRMRSCLVGCHLGRSWVRMVCLLMLCFSSSASATHCPVSSGITWDGEDLWSCASDRWRLQPPSEWARAAWRAGHRQLWLSLAWHLQAQGHGDTSSC